mgnify:CR=1 FL=1|tara:strand:+ start:2855 stop:3865 length:1011 start_codon:yes stop_codon:yes gene_type:complete
MLENLREKIKTAQDKDVEDKKGTQPKRYYAADADGDKMSKSTKDKRAAHFAKHGKKDDDDASAYKPAPGDKNADTKPSKYTKQYKKMFGEDAVSDLKAKHTDELEKLKARHERELETLKGRHERQQDTAKGSVEAEKEREKQRKEVQSESVNKTALMKKLKKIKGLSKEQLRVLSTLPSPVLTSMVQQLSQLVMGEDMDEACWDGYKQVGMKKKGDKMVPDCVPEEVEEGKLVADVDAILNAMVSEFKKQFGSLYRKNNEKGLAMLNRLGSMIGAKASSKMQQKGKLFLKMDLGPDADAGDYIKDFRKSDAPQFKGKSDKKIRQMAIAAYLDKKEK